MSGRPIPAESPSASRRRRSRRRAGGARSRSRRRGSAGPGRRGSKRSEHSSPHAYGPSLRHRLAAKQRADDRDRRARPLDDVGRVEPEPLDHRRSYAGRARAPPSTGEEVERCEVGRDLRRIGRVRARAERADDDALRRLRDRGLHRQRVRHERVVRHPHLVDTRSLGGDREIDDLARRSEVLDEPNADLHRARR